MTAALQTVVGEPQIVPAVTTPITAPIAAAQLRQWPEVDANNGPLLLSLIFVETGGGLKTQNYNVGNITAGDRYTDKAWRPPWFEVGPDSSPKLIALHARMLAGEAPKAFRAYPNFASGFSDFKAQLRTNFPEVLEAADTADARSFVDALSKRYSRDYGPGHYQTFEALQQRFQSLFSDIKPRETKRVSSLRVSPAAAWPLFALALWWALGRSKRKGFGRAFT
jgi:hypothetical protein